jgi:hypothetical protein
MNIVGNEQAHAHSPSSLINPISIPVECLSRGVEMRESARGENGAVSFVLQRLQIDAASTIASRFHVFVVASAILIRRYPDESSFGVFSVHPIDLPTCRIIVRHPFGRIVGCGGGYGRNGRYAHKQQPSEQHILHGISPRIEVTGIEPESGETKRVATPTAH